ncbi:hypothetical protein BDZ97DRAFT_1842464 [Flammula alnicola]|nr:hypothetical protein BDZ97DRAFT_1842464 [Flammula alnicola]
MNSSNHSRQESSENMAGPRSTSTSPDTSLDDAKPRDTTPLETFSAPHSAGHTGVAIYIPPPSSAFKSTNPTRHTKFWLYDGSIVLSVQNTLFRVHQTILANHSEVFADLFTIPQPEGSIWWKRFCELLNAVYIPDHFESLPADADLDTVLTFISGILRLSTKYMIRYLRQRCITLLLAKLPHTFEGYEAKSSASCTSPDRYRSDTVMRAIRLAQENNVPEALPYAGSSKTGRGYILARQNDHPYWAGKAAVGADEHVALFLLVFRRSPTCQSPLCAHARGPHSEWHEAYDTWESLNVCSDCEVWKYLPTWFELPPWEELREAQNR